MQSRMIAGSLGIVAVCMFADLPSLFQVVLLLTLSVMLILFAEYYSPLSSIAIALCRLAGMFLLGVVWAVFYGYGIVEQQLPSRWEGVDLWVQGTVVDLPVSRSTHVGQRREGARRNQDMQSFNFRIEGDLCDNSAPNAVSCVDGVRLIRLKWYEKRQIKPGQRWRLLVRLKKPRGVANPGGFDYQTWLIARGFGGNGYVRTHGNNQLLSDERFGVDRLRWRAAAILDQQLGTLKNLSIFKALVLGDKRGIDRSQWQLFSRTGTTHLMVISGLHVGLLAALGFVLGKSAVLLIDRRRSADRWGALISIIIAYLYTAAAGFSLPTQRALIMVGVCMVAIFFRRQISPVSGLLVAMFLCLAYDPLAAVGLSFWMSFTAVACIFLVVMGRKSTVVGPLYRSIKGNLASQYGVYVGLLPVLAILLGQLSFISPVANILMVPLFTVVVVPLTMLGALLIFISVFISAFMGVLVDGSPETIPFVLGFWQLLDGLVSFAFDCLAWLDANNTYGLLYLPGLPWSVKSLAVIGVAVLLLPKGFPLKFTGFVLLMPLLIYRPAPLPDGDVSVTVLDVGQGLSVVVQTGDHRLVYDTGPAEGDNFSAAAMTVIPFLRYRGIGSIDTLVLSHGDNDHAGGLADMRKAMPIDRVYYGEKVAGLPPASRHCGAGAKWTWNRVEFAFLTVAVSENSTKIKPSSNDLSCVMTITAGATKFLFTGDIGHKVESLLLGNPNIDLATTVLIAPHHGSSNSSSRGFVERVQAEHVVFSSGYKNQFRHPRPEVVDRYRAHRARIHTTAEHGAISFLVQDGKLQTVSHYRDTMSRYWL